VSDAVHVFGIRHHGPGSARSLLAALDALAPDAVLVEGPPDAEEILPLAAHAEMTPPVALLVFAADDPKRAVFYPFASFSPEWVAIRWALARGVSVRFIDLPQAHRLAESDPIEDGNADKATVRIDPLGRLAAAAGYSDGERFWDRLVESRRAATGEIFAAISEAMTALRDGEPTNDERDQVLERRREAFMRQSIRAALRDGASRPAIVCGAWHAPALADATARGRAKDDAAILQGLPKTKTRAAWVPWSYDRLSYRSGYGAGVDSPEWYDLLWSRNEGVVVEWLTRVARLLREQDLDCSSANVIEATRLAETLASLRGRSLPGLDELHPAALAVLCGGDLAPMALVRRKLIVGDRLGRVPDEAPAIPLQQDLARLQKSLRLAPSGDEKDVDFDLRQPNDLERSRLLHRLQLLEVPWSRRVDAGKTKGSFRERWRLQWRPEFVIALVEAGRFGNDVASAAAGVVASRARDARDLAALTPLLETAILADLPDAAATLVGAIRDRAALTADASQMMDALPPLADVCRYGNVRQTDAAMVRGVLDGLVARLCIGLSNACASLDDDAASAMRIRIVAVDAALGLLQDEAHLEAWRDALKKLADRDGLHGVVAGRATRLLHDAGAWPAAETSRRFGLALSTANAPAAAAAWVEGFLGGSGLLLVHDAALWTLVDEWMAALRDDAFVEVLPLLRRTFATFEPPERQKLGERAKSGAGPAREAASLAEFDAARAAAVLPVLAKLLGAEERP
jgi:uncharacterized protein DUF5682